MWVSYNIQYGYKKTIKSELLFDLPSLSASISPHLCVEVHTQVAEE